MKKLRVAINGFGRIGRVITRINLKRNLFDLVAINDINPDINNLLYLLKYDSNYGQLEADLEIIEANIVNIGGSQVRAYNFQDIELIPWYENNIDIIIDASGNNENYKKLEFCKHLFGYYIFTSDSRAIDNIVCDINEEKFSGQKYIASSTCDAIALAPLLKAILSYSDIEYGSLVTLHPWLSYQNLLDSHKIPNLKDEDGYALGRAASQSIIAKSTSAVSATDKLISGVFDKFHCISYRVPTATVSSAVISLILEKEINHGRIREILDFFKKNQRYKTMELVSDNIVSIDLSGSCYSSIIDLRWIKVDKKSIQLNYWYDNEWGYSSKVLDLIDYIGRSI